MANKMQSNFFTDLYKKFTVSRKRYYYYFMWVNKLNNSLTDFSVFTEDEFTAKYLSKKVKGKQTTGEKSLKTLKMWESTEEFQGLMQELYNFKMNQDFYRLYETYLEKAMSGDEKALNALKTIKKEIESLNKANRVKVKNIKDDEEEFDTD
jgi:hypothetical protein